MHTDTARDRLYRITLMLQAEIINSLQQAATKLVFQISTTPEQS
jgi:hypothetical protein